MKKVSLQITQVKYLQDNNYSYQIQKNKMKKEAKKEHASLKGSISNKREYLTFETAKGNQIWTASLGLAWKQMIETCEGKYSVNLEEKNISGRQTVDKLENSPVRLNDGDPETIYYKAAFQTEGVKAANIELKQKFPRKKLYLQGIKNDQVIFYGATQKVVKLKTAFYNQPDSMKYMFFDGKRMGCYQAMTPGQRSQIHIIQYTDEDNFILHVECCDQEQQLFFLKTRQKLQVDEAIDLVMKNQKSKGEQMSEKDVFKIPRIEINFTRTINELIGHKILVKEIRKYDIVNFFEDFSFTFEHIPAKIEIDDIYMCVPDSSQPILKPKSLSLNRGFWTIAKRRTAKHPYLAIYIIKPRDKQK